MTTPTHVLLAAFTADRCKAREYAGWAALGGFIPDLAIWVFTLYVWSRGLSFNEAWYGLYYQPGWQKVFNATHSIVLWVVILFFSVILGMRMITATAGGALGHIFLDFWVHVDDAYAHFFPISSYRFYSPVSYYDPAYFGLEVAILEGAIGLGLAWGLYRSFKTSILRILLLCARYSIHCIC